MVFKDIPARRISTISTEEANKLFVSGLSKLITDTLCVLLETKQLYQRISVPYDEFFEPVIKKGFQENAKI